MRSPLLDMHKWFARHRALASSRPMPKRAGRRTRTFARGIVEGAAAPTRAPQISCKVSRRGLASFPTPSADHAYADMTIASSTPCIDCPEAAVRRRRACVVTSALRWRRVSKGGRAEGMASLCRDGGASTDIAALDAQRFRATPMTAEALRVGKGRRRRAGRDAPVGAAAQIGLIRSAARPLTLRAPWPPLSPQSRHLPRATIAWRRHVRPSGLSAWA